jgi:uncharacterized protein YjbI with pentapeptide repeats
VSLWLLLVVGIVLGAALFAVGARMLSPVWGDEHTRADVGVAVITTTVISLAVFVLQILDENRLQRDDARRQDELANQTLRLQLGLSPALNKMDLRNQDLREINLPQKHLEEADLSGAHLEGANLEGVHLERARLLDTHLEGANLVDAYLDGANLEGAHLDGGATTLDRAHLRNANLFGAQLANAELYGADLRDAKAMNANFDGAVISGWNVARLQYDSRTVFPNGKTYSCNAPPCFLGDKAKPRR